MIKKVIKEVINIFILKFYFYLVGGEVFLNILLCIECFEEVKKYGYIEIFVIINVYWVKDEKKVVCVCWDFCDVGLICMEISWDVWYFDFIFVSVVNNCIKFVYDNNI